MRRPLLAPRIEVTASTWRESDVTALRYLIYGFLAIAPWVLLLSYRTGFSVDVGGFNFSLVGALKDLWVVVYAGVLAVSYRRAHAKPSLHPSPWVLSVAAFIALALLSIPAEQSTESVYLARTYILPLAVFLLIAVSPLTSAAVRIFLTIFVLNGVVFSVIGLAEFFFGVDTFIVGEPLPSLFPRVSGVFEGPNTFASHLVFPVAILAAFVFRPGRTPLRRLAPFLFTLVAYVLFLTASRSAILALGAILLSWAIKRAATARVLAVTAVVIAIPLSILAIDVDYSWNLFHGLPEATAQRLGIWRDVLESRDKEVVISTAKSDSVEGEGGELALATTTNSYLRLYVDYGVVGLVFYGLTILGAVVGCARRNSRLAVLALSLLAAYLVIGFFHNVIIALPQMLFLMFIVGLAFNPFLTRDDERGATTGTRPSVNVVVGDRASPARGIEPVRTRAQGPR